MLRFNVRNVVWLVVGLAVMVVGLSAAASAQASAIPMVYNNSTSTALVVDGFETGDPTVGTVSTYNGYSAGTTTIVTASSQGIAAREGLQVAKLNRNPGDRTGIIATVGTATGASDVTTSTFAVYLANTSGANDVVFAPAVTPAENGVHMGFFEVLGTGVVDWYNAGAHNLTATATSGAWNTLVFTHTNGTATWGISVNGSATETATFTDTWFGDTITGALGGWEIFANDNATTAYVDAVPEPSTLVLLGAGLLGLLAYAWRKRK